MCVFNHIEVRLTFGLPRSVSRVFSVARLSEHVGRCVSFAAYHPNHSFVVKYPFVTDHYAHRYPFPNPLLVSRSFLLDKTRPPFDCQQTCSWLPTSLLTRPGCKPRPSKMPNPAFYLLTVLWRN